MKASPEGVKVTPSLSGVIMFVAPVAIGPFLMEDGGQLTLRVPEPVPGFSFAWRACHFTVKISHGTLLLRAACGRVPSTADGRERRDRALAALRALPSVLPGALRLRLLPDHRIQVESEHGLDWPTTAASLFAPLVAMLVRMAPVINLMEEAGLGNS